MHVGLTNVIIVIACAILILLVMLLYLRSRQGDQRIIRVINQVLLPLLSAIVITLGFIYYNAPPANAECTQGAPGILKYVAAIGTVLIVSLGVTRYAFSQSRDRRFITQSVLLAIVLVLAILIVEVLFGCM